METPEASLEIFKFIIENEFKKGIFTNLDYYIQNNAPIGLSYVILLATIHNKLDCVTKLVNIGAEIDLAIIIAIQKGYIEIISYFIKSGKIKEIYFSTIIVDLLEKEKPNLVKTLLDDDKIKNQFNINYLYEYPLRICVKNNYLDLAELLIKLGCDVNIFNGYLIETASKNSLPMVKLLINNTKKEYYKNAINIARNYNQTEIVDFLSNNL